MPRRERLHDPSGVWSYDAWKAQVYSQPWFGWLQSLARPRSLLLSWGIVFHPVLVSNSTFTWHLKTNYSLNPTTTGQLTTLKCRIEHKVCCLVCLLKSLLTTRDSVHLICTISNAYIVYEMKKAVWLSLLLLFINASGKSLLVSIELVQPLLAGCHKFANIRNISLAILMKVKKIWSSSVTGCLRPA